MADAGIPKRHLRPMNPQGEEQDDKDNPQLQSTPGLSVKTQTLCFLLEGVTRMNSKREKSLFPVKHLLRKSGPRAPGKTCIYRVL